MPRRSPLRQLRTPTLYTFGEDELLNLDDRTALVLRMRSGMLDGQLYMLREVGEKIGVKGERVRQIQNQGLVRIRGLREVQRHMASNVKARRDHSGKPDMYRGSHPTRQASLSNGKHPQPSQGQPPMLKDNASIADSTEAGLEALGEAVKRLRIERGIGPRSLAFNAEIGENTLVSLEKGETEPRWGTLRRLAGALDVELPDILSKAEELEDEMGRRA
jgi:DNA-binding XRE family transcriptional regulator